MWIVYVLPGIAVLAVLMTLLLLKPGKRRPTTPASPVPFAHRGLHSGDSRIPENSLAAFRQAAQKGFAVELDIQLTADGQVVVFHDATLMRLCQIDSRVDALTYEELKQYPLLGSDQHIPLLSQVLEVLDGVPLLCEFKSMRSFTDTRICSAAWPLLASYKGPVWIESFNPLLVRWFKRNHPQVMRGILSMRFKKDNKEVTPLQGKLLTALLTNALTKPDFIAYQLSDHREHAFRLCRWLYRPLTLAWTVRSPEEEQEAKNAGFDGVIFEGFLPEEKKFENF
ncbi:MAG: glycerophosphodiester phosphodiesterase [Clostridia bacterium]|nr:glycerophosphodiester phosphodiesterase [Clostridia bacterium]